MCDVRQLARRPIKPGGQQLLTADLRVLGEDPGRGGQERVWDRRDKENHVNNLLPPPPPSVISDKNTLIL